MARVFDQKVTATMHRVFSDEVGHLFLRKNTQVHIGSTDQLMGAVIMSNPGSYTPKYAAGDWKAFSNGEGQDQIHGWGYPDMTMQNIIEVLQVAAEVSGYALDGKIDIYNLSAVVQPKGKNAATYHNYAVKALADELLYESWMNTQSDFKNHMLKNDYHFVIIGFLAPFLIEKQLQVQRLAVGFPDVFYATDDVGRWSHPRRWKTEIQLKFQMIEKLTHHFQSCKPRGKRVGQTLD